MKRVDNRYKNTVAACEKPVMQISAKTGAVIKIWGSQTEAAKILNFCISGISNAANGRYETYKGYYWKHANLSNMYRVEKGMKELAKELK